MSKAVIQEKINKTAQEMKRLVDRSKRKLAELETLLSFEEIKYGNFDTFNSAKDLLKRVK